MADFKASLIERLATPKAIPTSYLEQMYDTGFMYYVDGLGFEHAIFDKVAETWHFQTWMTEWMRIACLKSYISSSVAYGSVELAEAKANIIELVISDEDRLFKSLELRANERNKKQVNVE